MWFVIDPLFNASDLIESLFKVWIVDQIGARKKIPTSTHRTRTWGEMSDACRKPQVSTAPRIDRNELNKKNPKLATYFRTSDQAERDALSNPQGTRSAASCVDARIAGRPRNLQLSSGSRSLAASKAAPISRSCICAALVSAGTLSCNANNNSI